MGEVGCYTLDAYCDRCAEHRSFIGRTLAEARREARKRGWRFNHRLRGVVHASGHPRVLCPTCASGTPSWGKVLLVETAARPADLASPDFPS